MSTLSRADLEAMDRDELIETVLELDREVADLREEVADHREHANRDRAAIRAEREDLLDELREEMADLRDDLGRTERRLHQERSKVVRRVANLEDHLGFEDEDVIALAEGGEEALRESPLSRLLEVGPEAIDGRSTATLYRAETLARNWIRWGHSEEEDGEIVERTLATKRDDLRTRLEDRRDESLEWGQVYRAMQKIAEMGPKNIRLVERGDWGKTLVQDCRGGDADR